MTHAISELRQDGGLHLHLSMVISVDLYIQVIAIVMSPLLWGWKNLG